jgi:hypothetical protein
MKQHYVIGLYFALSILNGSVVLAIALLCSAPVLFAFFIGGIAVLTSLALLCLMCLPVVIDGLLIEKKRTA